jgi:Zn-finger nucleic acid-binding protein
MSVLTCPKCHGQMRQYERNGVYVDQCTECRGIFLDRGELERLVDAEARWGAGPPIGPGRYEGGDDRDEAWGGDRRGSGHYGKPHHKRHKKSFLEGLFDD